MKRIFIQTEFYGIERWQFDAVLAVSFCVAVISRWISILQQLGEKNLVEESTL